MKTKTETRTAYVEVRTQPAKGSGWAQGPDTYVAVQIVPAGVVRLTYLNHRVAVLRGIEIRYCGEGYAKRTGPRSALGQAMVEANQIADEINDAREMVLA